MKPVELVVLSGKGGTGKTSVLASFAALAETPVLADCDVDAADLHLLLAPRIVKRETFISGHEAHIRPADCLQCGACLAHCRFGAVEMLGKRAGEAEFRIRPASCEGCGVCVAFCPVKAIDFPDCVCGESYVSETRHGPMAHARLAAGAENSGKLVSEVRRSARQIAEEQGRELVLVDGPPGISCPVIATLTGADRVLVVTEPTLSGEHDLLRVLELTHHFKIPTWVCVNKWDLNPEICERIESAAHDAGAEVLGRIRYDKAFTEAQIAATSVVENRNDGCAADIRELWNTVCTTLPSASAKTDAAEKDKR